MADNNEPISKKLAALVAERHLRRRKVEETTGLSRSAIYDEMKKGNFPRPVRLTGRAVAWRESDIANWLASRRKTDAA